MKAIRIEITDWQAEVYTVLANQAEQDAARLLHQVLEDYARSRIDFTCSSLLRSESGREMERRLTELFRR